MPTRYNEHVGESEIRIAPMSLMARQIMREVVENRREASRPCAVQVQVAPALARQAQGRDRLHLHVLDRRDPEGEVMEATADGRKVRAAAAGALLLTRQRRRSRRRAADVARKPDDDLRVPGASPPPQQPRDGSSTAVRRCLWSRPTTCECLGLVLRRDP